MEKAKKKEKKRKRRYTTGKREGPEVDRGLTEESAIRFVVKWPLSKACRVLDHRLYLTEQLPLPWF